MTKPRDPNYKTLHKMGRRVIPDKRNEIKRKEDKKEIRRNQEQEQQGE